MTWHVVGPSKSHSGTWDVSDSNRKAFQSFARLKEVADQLKPCFGEEGHNHLERRRCYQSISCYIAQYVIKVFRTLGILMMGHIIRKGQ